ncbi:phage major capsid protein [Bacillus sp. FJAT-45350]|uniref:phage major capsid protein n=1 Tax=Bacillus sp. FJAT-45350 TaxID=2011014 RepID=UPI000BB8D66E|nr:phage major capsid protein [Bacillus sp. FJAT-45350]
MKDWLKKQLKAKEEARAALKEKGKKSENVEEVRSIGEQIESLDKEIAEFRSQIEAIEKEEGQDEKRQQQDFLGEHEERSKPAGQLNALGTYGVGNGQIVGDEKREQDLTKTYEERGAALKEKRSVTFEIDEVPELRAVSIGGGTLINEKKYSKELNEKFSEVSSLVDVVSGVPLMGGESYAKGFEISSGEGDYTSEDGNYADAEPVFDYVTIGKAKITAYAEMTDESMKLPNVDYQSRVAKSIGEAIKKKITKQIIVGPGGANALTGIFNAPTNVIPTSTDIEVSAIDADTLDEIVFGYGGDEEVEGGGYLILNKRDLAAFAKVRSSDGKKLYKIKKDGNTGTISSDDSFEVPFIINSACAPISSDSTSADTYCMAYGMVKAYEMPIFSPITVEESRDFKFRTGQIAYRGSVWAGGNVAMHKGFVRVKKVAAV